MKDTHDNLKRLMGIIQKNVRYFEGKAPEINEEEI